GHKMLKPPGLSGWTYIGAAGSAFANGGPAQVGAVGISMPRTRAGVFVGVRDPRLSAGAEWDTRKDASESGANTLTNPRVETDSTGRLIAAFATITPFQLINDTSTFPLGFVTRWARFKPNTNPDGY